MKKMRLKNKTGFFDIGEVKTLSELGKFSGLMFTPREKAQILLFKFEKPVRHALHSFFVFFKFLAVWTDDENNIIEIRIVKPFNPLVKPKKPFYNLVEIPINEKYRNLAKAIVAKN
jgi:hypothetical protein